MTNSKLGRRQETGVRRQKTGVRSQETEDSLQDVGPGWLVYRELSQGVKTVSLRTQRIARA